MQRTHLTELRSDGTDSDVKQRRSFLGRSLNGLPENTPLNVMPPKHFEVHNNVLLRIDGENQGREEEESNTLILSEMLG
ncbi:hypothetical protein INR49_001572 [Caranx melampygus]|nr:hypothetical protein INR49_001572 [Caranx melampygus]